MRNNAIDILKLVLSITIIAIHTNYLEGYSEFANYFTVEGLFRVSVPTFFIINGFYYFEFLKAKSLRMYLNKVITLYVFYTFLYSYFILKLAMNNSGAEYLLYVLKDLVFGYGHLWYLSSLIMLAAVSKNLTKINPTYWHVCVVLFALLIGWLIQGSVFNIDNEILSKNRTLLYRNLIFVGFPFFFTGILLANFIAKKRDAILNKFWFVLLILIASFFLVIIEAAFNYHLAPGYHRDILLSSLPFSCVLFLTVYLLGLKHQLLFAKGFGRISTATFFIHPLFIAVLSKLGVDSGFLMFSLVSLLSLIFSLSVIWINDNIRPLPAI